LVHALSLVIAARPTALQRRFARVAIDRSAGMRQDSFWWSRARWLCEAGQGTLWHGLGPPRRRRMTTVSAAGRLERTRFSRRHGIASIHMRKKVIKTIVGIWLLYRQAMHPYLAIRPQSCRDLLVGTLISSMCCMKLFARPYYLRGLTCLGRDLLKRTSGLKRPPFGAG
jgi:hypothetical protein